MKVMRGFVPVAEGQVHYRTAGQGRTGEGRTGKVGAGEVGAGEGRPPLVMLHPSPGSAFMLQPLIAALAAGRRVIATDTLGNGDSSPPADPAADIAYFADAHLRALDALGVERFDLYGSHTGANLAVEIALARPERVRRLILDGVSLYSAEERADMLANYAPGVVIDQMGSQLHWIWHFVRDVYLFWPWYRRDAGHRRALGLPSADDLHDKVVEVLKAARTYHIPYRAAIGYDKAPRLPLVRTPTLLACARTDMFMEYLDQVTALMPGARTVVTPGMGTPDSLRATAAVFMDFLDADDPA